MMSFFNNQGEIDWKPTTDQSFPGIEQDFRVSSEEICDEKDAGGVREEVKASSPAKAVASVDPRASEDISPDSSSIPSADGVFLEEKNEVKDKAGEESPVLEGRSESSGIEVREIRVSEDSRDFFVVEPSEKKVVSVEDIEVEQQKAKGKGFDDGVVETSVEHELSTNSYDSASLDSSDLLSDTGRWMHGFEKGDMVWGKVKSHPWWPGLIFDESFASPSVRKTKREGHVLVAFFGDCSYGWFDPAELIPFDLYYAEKSKQTGSRNFVKAVEEAVDEASRRQSLGLTCRCHNKYNFRPTSVPGYFSVDVVNSEFGGVYSTRQIKKARDGLVPLDMISFLKQLALIPKDAERGTMDWISNMAQLLSLRKATFEEFDETYAQAFSVEPLRPSRDALAPQEWPINLTNRAAPLSGRLVIAEALGVKRKCSGKSAGKASKDKVKKDKYLFKRRDDAPQFVTHRLVPPSSDSPSLVGFRPPVVVAGVPEPTDFLRKQENVSAYFDSVPQGQATAGVFGKVIAGLPNDDYVLQKRQPADGGDVLVEAFRIGPIGDLPTKVEAMVDEMKVEAPVFAGDGQIDIKQEVKPEIGVTIGIGGFNQNPSVLGVNQMIGDRMPTAGVMIKKEKKRQRKEDGGQGMPDPGTKKKRKKKDAALESVLDHPSLKLSKVGKQGDVEQIGIPLPDSACPELSKTDIESCRPLGIHDVAITLPPFDLKPQEHDTRLLSNDLSALALDPFHGSDRNASVIVRHFFLRFRNLVYQKSLVLPPANESDRFQIQSEKSELQPGVRLVVEVGYPVATHQGEARGPTQASKHVKPASKAAVRPDDPTKSDRKRAPSDRQEQILAKKVKKISQLKELASEKKAVGTQKPPEGNSQENLKGANSLSAKGSKADLSRNQNLSTTITATTPVPKKKETVKKQEEVPAPRVVSPTFLFMKFPPRSTLPSIASMKARFGRFGPLDLSGARVYWGSYTCKLLFKYRVDAQAAYMYARNNPVFGPFKVDYSLRDADTLEPTKNDVDDSLPSRRSDTLASDINPSALKSQIPAKSVQLKSCLKKPNGDDTGSAVKETPRVKFLLDSEGGRSEPSVMVRGNGTCSSSIPPKDLNGKNLKSVSFLPHQPSTHTPLHPPLVRNSDMPPSSQLPTRVSQESSHVDISYEMLNLLRRCSDIVTNVRSAFGYVPYHAL